MSRNKTVLAAAITVMLYTRPAIVAGEGLRLTAFRSGNIEGHYAIFAEDEALERLESGFWVDHPNGLSELDKAIAEAAAKEAEQDKRDADDEEAARLKKEQDAKVDKKAPESTPTASEPKDAPKAAEGEKEPETQPETLKSTQSEGLNAAEPEVVEKKADAPKDGEKVDGAKVNTQKAKK